MEPLISASRLSKTFHRAGGLTRAVVGLNLAVAPGEIYGLVGPDGAGKTTTMRLLCGALRPDPDKKDAAPEISITGIDLLRHTDPARARLGYLAQRFAMYEDLTVLENLRFFAEVRGLKATAWQPRCLQILDFVGLGEYTGRRAGQLSGGMKQKLGLAAALVHRPQVLLLDEPTTGVDPVTRQDFWQLLIRLVAEQDVAVLVSTPYMDEAARCQRVGFLRQGQLLVEGAPEALRQRLDGRILELYGQPLALLRRVAQADPQVEDAQMFGDRLHLRVQPGALQPALDRLSQAIPAAGGQLSQARPIPPGLEDVFIALLEENEAPA
jgi:ABC-2 type transport system ATP-binding protein